MTYKNEIKSQRVNAIVYSGLFNALSESLRAILPAGGMIAETQIHELQLTRTNIAFSSIQGCPWVADNPAEAPNLEHRKSEPRVGLTTPVTYPPYTYWAPNWRLPLLVISGST